MSSRPPQILHPTDLTSGDSAAFEHALRLSLDFGLELCLLHVVENSDPDLPEFPHVRSTLRLWQENQLDSAVQEPPNLSVSKALQTHRSLIPAVAAHCQSHVVDLVVLTSHQRNGLDRLIHPPHAEPIARQVHTNTLILPRTSRGFVDSATGRVQLETIVIPVATDPDPGVALEEAHNWIRRLGAKSGRIQLVHVGTADTAPVLPATSIPGWRQEAVVLPGGEVVDRLSAHVSQVRADLVVLSTRSRHGWMGNLLGSTGERLLREVACPVLFVPGE